MASPALLLKQQLDGLVSSMSKEGFLDGQFNQIQSLQDETNPGFVAEVITLFCEDSEKILTELNKHLNQPNVDYEKVDAYVHQLKGSSSSVGAQRVKLACVGFRQVCEEKNREGCIQAFNMIKQEYLLVKNKFELMVQAGNCRYRLKLNGSCLTIWRLEQRIAAFDAKV